MSTPSIFRISQLTSPRATELGARVRRINEGHTATRDAITERIVQLLDQTFRDDNGIGDLVLTRAYRTARFEQLTEAQRTLAGEPLGDEARYLVLTATTGVEAEWRHVDRSHGHQVIQVATRELETRLPMIARLLADLGAPGAALAAMVEDEGVATAERSRGLFFVPKAEGSPYVPAQRDFVVPYGVESVVGFGGAMTDGSLFAVVLFSRVPIAEEVARRFELIALHARIALSTAVDVTGNPLLRSRARVHAYDELLRVQEYQYLMHISTVGRDVAAMGQRLAELEANRRRENEEGVARRNRTQRAMLNVIEDLREARTMLEQRVAQRTEELAASNAELQRKNVELEQFAYVASHDLQEPLRSIAGYLQLLQERYGDRLDEGAHQFIGYGIAGASRMQELIEALLQYSRVANLRHSLKAIELDTVLDDVLHAVSASVNESHATFERRPLPVVLGDPVQLRQLLQNLISNAIKFAGDRPPRVEIWAETAQTAPGYVEVAVRDHGIGFDPKYAEQVFKVFRRLQRRYPGTGIGLAICKKIAEHHGGLIRAASIPGEGTTFTVTLQRAEASR